MITKSAKAIVVFYVLRMLDRLEMVKVGVGVRKLRVYILIWRLHSTYIYLVPVLVFANTPAAYQVIVLLEMLSKIVEKLIANRLSVQACKLGLIHPSQYGLLPGVSTIHAAVSLTHEVVIAQKLKLKAASLFLDIKGGFDNIRPAQLSGLLRAKGVSPYIVSWMRSFLSRRTCRLKFQGCPGNFKCVAVGTPQGSPISPWLFVLYVASLHRGAGMQNTFSFVDDFALTTICLSHRRNIQILQVRFKALWCRAKKLGLAFSIPKSDFIHLHTPKDHSPRCPTPIHLDSEVFLPKEEVRWLGYRFTPNLASIAHFNCRLTLAFAIIKKLSPPGSGLTTLQTCCLVYSLLLPVVLYGADLLVPNGAMAQRLEVCWHRALRSATNCF